MPKRLQIASDSGDWAVEVSGNQVSLAPEVKRSVVRENDQLRVNDLLGSAEVDGDVAWVTVRGEVFAFTVTHGAARAKGGRDQDAFTPPMSATVVRIAVKPGDQVHDGDVLIALEAMKMELPIRAPRDGVVRAVNCREGELVQPGQILIDLE